MRNCDWEQRKLGELASFSKGAGYTKGDLKATGKPIILYGRLYTKYETVIENVDTFVDEKEKSVISAGNEVIVPASGETSEDISRASVVAKPGIIIGGDLNIVKPNTEIDPSFLALTISNGRQQKELSKKAQGKSVVHLHNSDLKEVTLVYPKKEEQNRIGNFFKNLDNTIALHQRKLSLFNQLKATYLKRMFPQNKENMPILRFADFSDLWDQRKLGEVVNFQNGRAYKQQELLESGKYRVLRVGNFNTNDRWYYSDLELEENKYANSGDLLYLWATNFGPEIWDEEKVIYHYHIWKLDVHSSEVDKQYLYTWLVTDKEKIKQTTNGTTMVHVTKGNMEQREFQLPINIKEQKKIGSFFKQLDDTIALHQSKLEKLKDLKQVLLVKMFV